MNNSAFSYFDFVEFFLTVKNGLTVFFTCFVRFIGIENSFKQIFHFIESDVNFIWGENNLSLVFFSIVNFVRKTIVCRSGQRVGFFIFLFDFDSGNPKPLNTSQIFYQIKYRCCFQQNQDGRKRKMENRFLY